MAQLKFALLALAVFAMSAQTACTAIGMAAGAGAAAGIAATQEGGISGAVSDVEIKAKINDLWFRTNVDMFRKLNLTVDQGRVLITGVVQNPEHRVEAVRLAWQPKGVKQVINEIRVADSDGVEGYARDTWITAQLRTKMTFHRDIQSINYSIDTVQGIVYLMGVARNQAELDLVTETARGIKGVKQVISYVKMLGEPILSTSSGAAEMGAAPANAVVTPSSPADSSVTITPLTANPAAVTSATLPP